MVVCASLTGGTSCAFRVTNGSPIRRIVVKRMTFQSLSDIINLALIKTILIPHFFIWCDKGKTQHEVVMIYPRIAIRFKPILIVESHLSFVHECMIAPTQGKIKWMCASSSSVIYLLNQPQVQQVFSVDVDL